jgi:HdeA/HdeB family
MSQSIVLCFALCAVPLCLACEKEGTEADKTNTAESDFAKVRDEYRKQKQSDLDSLDKVITDVETKEKASAGKAKEELGAMLSSLKTGRDTFKGDLHSTEQATASSWDSTKARLDKEWADLKTVADKASSAVSSAATSHKPGEMSCEDFVAIADVERPKIVYWMEGFNKSGKAVDSAIDVQEIDKVVPILVTECGKNPKGLLSTAIQQHALPASKMVSTAPKPKAMRCDEFVALDDTVKPKVVYWAEGFDKDGTATDATVDIAETDRVVPVLVKECKEEPTLTLWQKLKKYL